MSALSRAMSRLRLAGPATDRELGAAGERAAARLLRRGGYKVLGRNVRVRIGEADIVALDPDGRTIVVVEVKTRRVERVVEAGKRRAAPAPEMSVHQHKQLKLLAVARYLAKANGWVGRPIRIDVVAVEWPREGRMVVRHRRNAVVRSR